MNNIFNVAKFQRQKLYFGMRPVSYYFFKIKRVFCSDSGAVSVEFAMILPLLLAMYLGMAASVIGIETKSKLGSVAESMGGLTGRTTSVTDADLLNFLSASGLLMSPYKATPVKIRMGSIARDKNGVSKKCWGVSLSNASTPPTITTIQPPDLTELALTDDLMPSKTTLLVVEASYVYKSPAGFFPDITLVQKYYVRPRTSSEVTRKLNDGSIISCPSLT